MLTGDVASEGWRTHPQDLSTSGKWPKAECGYHVNEKEILATYKGLSALYSILDTKAFIKYVNLILIYVSKQGGCKSKNPYNIAKHI